jgi:hypothetical protein
MNTRDPLAAMDPNYAPWVLNFEPEPQYLRARNGYVRHSNLAAVADAVYGLVSYGYANLFAYCYKSGANNKVYDITHADYETGKSYAVGEKVRGVTSNHIYTCSTAITSSTTEPTGTGAGTENDDDGVWTWVQDALVYTTGASLSGMASVGWSIKYRGRVGFLGPGTAPLNTSAVWDGSSWAALGFTYNPGSGAAVISAVCATNYRGRVYLFKDQYLYYSDLTGVTGACSRIDMSLILDTSADIVWCGTLVDSTNKPTESMLAFGTSDGEVLVYAGDNPAATNWEMIGRLKLSPALNYQGILEIQGDIWIATVTGIISLRRALTVGQEKLEDASVSSAIDPYWRKMIAVEVAKIKSLAWTWLQQTVRVTMSFWPEQNKVYVAIWGWLDADGDPHPTVAYGTIFVCNLYTGAWTIHQGATSAASLIDPKYLTYFNDNIFYVSTNQDIYKVGTGYADQVASTGAMETVPYALHSAYTNLGGKFKQCVGFEPLMKTDFTGSSVTMKSAVDFGRKVSAACSHALIDGHQSPFYAAGNQGAYVQYRMEGNTDTASTDGLELYSMGVAIK